LESAREQITSFITGLRKEESRRLQEYELLGRNPILPVQQLNPLINWTDEDIWLYLKEFSCQLILCIHMDSNALVVGHVRSSPPVTEK
jgi:hypothetical protein